MANDVRTFEWTIALKDQFTKPMKAVKSQWQKTTEAGVRQSKRMKAGVAGLSKGVKKFTKDLKDNVTQIKSFSKAIVAGLSLIGVGALAVGLLGALKKLVMVGIEMEEQTLELVTVTNAYTNSAERLSVTARNLSIHLGEDYEKTVQMTKALADIRPVTDDAAGSFEQFTMAAVEYSTATGTSVEAVGQLYAETERLTGETHGLRRLGDAMKYWADQSILTNAEIQAIAASTTQLLRMLPQGQRGRVQGQLIGISAIFANALGDPQALQGVFTQMHDVINASPLRDFVAGALPGGMATLDEALKAGDYAKVFEALVRASQAKQKLLEGQGLSFLNIAEAMQAETGLSSEMLQALTNVQAENIIGQLEEEKVRGAASKAAQRRLDSTMRRWNRLKQTFLNIIARLSGPLMKFMNTIIDPLFKFFQGLADATETFINTLNEMGDQDMSFWEKLKTAVKAFWDELGGDQYIEDIWNRITSWLIEHDVGEWIGEKILRPALRATFSERVADLLLGPEAGAAPVEITRAHREQAFSDIGRLVGVGRYDPQLERIEAQRGQTKEAFLAALEDPRFATLLRSASTARAFDPEKSAQEISVALVQMFRGDFATAVDSALEVELAVTMGDYMLTRSRELAEE